MSEKDVFDVTSIFRSLDVCINEVESIEITITPDEKFTDLKVGQEIFVKYIEGHSLEVCKIKKILDNGDIVIELEF